MRNPLRGLFGRKPDPETPAPEPPPAPPVDEPKPEPESKPKRNADHLARYQWKPGQSGNPGGRKAGPSLSTRLREIGQRTDPAGKELAEAAMERLWELAVIDGDIKALREILLRLDGRVPLATVDQIRGTLTDAINEAEAALKAATTEPTEQCTDSASDEPGQSASSVPD